MPRTAKPKCLMCDRRPGRYIEAVASSRPHIAEVYVNATKLPVFCSMRCAANYALLWIEGIETERLKELGHRLPDGYYPSPR